MGMVFKGLDPGLLQDHLLSNSARYQKWQECKAEFANCRGAAAALRRAEHSVPIEVRALGKGQGVQRMYYQCGPQGLLAKKWRRAAGEPLQTSVNEIVISAFPRF